MSKLLLWKSQKEVACRSTTGLFIGAQSAVAVRQCREREGERKRDRVNTHPGFLGSLYQTLRHSAPPKRHFSAPPAVSLLGGPALFFTHIQPELTANLRSSLTRRSERQGRDMATTTCTRFTDEYQLYEELGKWVSVAVSLSKLTYLLF